ncbi:MAG: RiPP maturation radical SAM C-methyltransferase [Desulfobacterales bacterium]|nr:RiPP maturation radical SAM C-methyltransferase [Desulfobacterales bacterium]
MNSTPEDGCFRIALVSPPWPLFNRPSIQLGSLKAFIQSRFSRRSIQVEAHHFYLEVAKQVGYRRYHDISQRMWPAEAVFAALLYPEQRPAAARLFQKETAGMDGVLGKNFDRIVESSRKAAAQYVQATDWKRYGLVGFSMCLCQMTSTLYLIRRIKQRCPGLPVVVGGGLFEPDSMQAFFRIFPEIDAVVLGEGERPLEKIVAHLMEGNPIGDLRQTGGVITRTGIEPGKRTAFCQVPELDRLPVPDFEDYFRLLKSFGPGDTFFPTLPLEISRGCWWQSSKAERGKRGCAFCNLNLQWSGYRSKSPKRAAAEIDELTSRYQALSVALTDNLLPRRESQETFDRIGSLGKDLALFAELRPTTSPDLLRKLGAAGVREVQIGIEALSSRLLKKLNKGTSAIQNLETMKHCEALGIKQTSNLILCFPGSDQEDVRQTLRALDFASPFRPLKTVYFWLGVGSRVYRNPRRFGLKAVYNHPRYRALFPAEVTGSVRLLVQTYRGDRVLQQRLWRPVKQRVRQWISDYAELKRSGEGPILGFRDGRDFLIIRQRRTGGEPIHHRLTGTSRKIYLHCSRHRSFNTILQRFPEFSEDKIRSFLHMMIEKRLMFEENDRYLSLAIPRNPQ